MLVKLSICEGGILAVRHRTDVGTMLQEQFDALGASAFRGEM